MAFDGITVAALTKELKETICDGRIAKIAQPESDELLLTIKTKEGQRRLSISASASLPLIYLTNDNKPSPMTAPNFCMLLRKHIGNGRIVDVSQPCLERIIQLRIEHLDELGDLRQKTLVVEIMGKHSNIIFCDEKDQIIDGRTIQPGDTILGLASSGPHSNGFSLIRKVVEVAGADWNMPFDGATLADRAMEPTRIYVKQVLEVMKSVKIKGMAHITGGGLVENVPRVLPEGVQAVIDGKSWTRPAIFDWLQEKGNIDSHEMHRVFNNGIGLVVIVSAEDAEKARAAFEAQGEKVFTIGTVAKLPEGEAPCVVR